MPPRVSEEHGSQPTLALYNTFSLAFLWKRCCTLHPGEGPCREIPPGLHRKASSGGVKGITTKAVSSRKYMHSGIRTSHQTRGLRFHLYSHSKVFCGDRHRSTTQTCSTCLVFIISAVVTLTGLVSSVLGYGPDKHKK